MVASRIRFSIVIAHQPGNDGAVPSFESWNIAIQYQVLAMLVMAAMADHVSRVVQKRSRLQEHARLRRKMVYRLQLVKQQNA